MRSTLSPQQAGGQAAYFTGEGGAGHQGLAAGWQAGGDVLDVFDEAHVQHAVGFVQHQHLDVLEHGAAALDVVDQAARGGDQDVQRVAQGADLGRVGHTADHAGHAQMGHEAAVIHGGLGHLHGQFTGGHQHEDARATGFALAGALFRVLAGGQDPHQGGQHESGGLAAAGAGAHAQVLAGNGGRHGARLHVSGFFVVGGLQGTHEDLIEAQGIEAHDFFHDTRQGRMLRPRQIGAVGQKTSPPTAPGLSGCATHRGAGLRPSRAHAACLVADEGGQHSDEYREVWRRWTNQPLGGGSLLGGK